jgi:hypothetical protein
MVVFFRNNPKKDTMPVSKEMFGEYLSCLQKSQQEQVKLSDTKAVTYFYGKRYIEVMK